MVEPESLVLKHLRAIRGDMGKVRRHPHDEGGGLVSMRRLSSGVIPHRDHGHDVRELKARRIERHLELTE